MVDTSSPRVAAPDNSEVEWQLDADDLDAVERWLESDQAHAGLHVRPAARKQIVDYYIDTDDLRLYAAGFAARLRGQNGTAEATLKSVVSEVDANSGLRRRLELNEPLRYPLLHSLVDAHGAVGARIRRHAAVRELRVLFTVRTDRRTAIVAGATGIDLGEVAIDDTTIEAGDRTASIRRIEVEALASGAERALEPFVARLRAVHHLRPGTSSKFRGGLDLAVAAGVIHGALPVPPGLEEQPAPAPAQTQAAAPVRQAVPPPLRTTTLSSAASAAAEDDAPPAPSPAATPPRDVAPLPDGSLAALIRDVIATQSAAIRDNEAGTRLGDDPEALHDMRVAVRRLRTAFRLFRKSLPSADGPGAMPASEVEASLRWLAAELGGVRDLDVQLERVGEWRAELASQDAASLDALADLLHGRRDAARAELLAALDTPRLPALYAGLDALAAAGPDRYPKRSRRPALREMPRIVRKQQRALWERIDRIEAEGDAAPATHLHETRIHAKRLRYAAEFATPLYGKPASALVSSLKRTQDVLGLHQDAEVAIAELRDLASETGGTLPAPTVFAMGEVAERYRESQRVQREVLPGVLARVGKRWKRLRRTMREQQEAG